MVACKCKKTRYRVQDKAYFSDQHDIGKKMSETPEGFLICEAVPIARIGEQLYGDGETPIAAGADGICRIQRDEAEVFRPETMASFEGKDVVDEHPDEGVTPDNWRDLAVGHVQNVRRGTGVDDEYLFADLIIKHPDAIAAVRAGKREVSCGYDADYEETGPGQGRQLNIVGNHVALVLRGRCGPRCAIRDGERLIMPKKQTMRDYLRSVQRKLGIKDADMPESMDDEVPAELMDAAVEPDMSGGEGGGNAGGVTIHNHLHPEGDAMRTEGDRKVWDEEGGELPPWFVEHVAQNNARFDELSDKMDAMMADMGGEDITDANPDAETDEQKAARMNLEGQADEQIEFEEEAPPGTGDKARKAKDSAYFADSFQETLALAEILAPGIKLPTYDAKAKPKGTIDALCGLRRRALDTAYANEELKPLIDTVLGGRTLDTKKLTCGATRNLFRMVGAVAKQANTATLDHASVGAGGGIGTGTRKIKSPADINKLNSERYAQA